MYWLRLFLLCQVLSAQPPGRLLLYEQTRTGVDTAIREWKQKGVSRVQIVLLPDGAPKPNAFGEFALGYGGQQHLDLSLPNPAFFQHLDWVLKRLASSGITAAVQPAELKSGVVAANGEEKWFEFGRYLGKRYMKVKGIVWIQSAGPLTAIDQGIRQFDTLHPFETARD